MILYLLQKLISTEEIPGSPSLSAPSLRLRIAISVFLPSLSISMRSAFDPGGAEKKGDVPH